MAERRVTDRLIKAFEAELWAGEKSEATVEKYMRDLRHFAAFAKGRSVSKALSMEYKASLGQQYAPASANSMIAALNSFLRFAGMSDCCVKQFKIQKKAFCSESRELKKEEYFSLIKTAERRNNKRLSMLIQTICATGIRISELEYITVEAVRKGEAVVSCKGKTRTVFIVSSLRKKLLRYAQRCGIKTGLLFVTRTGKVLNRSNVWTEMKGLCAEAGVAPDKVFPHNLRHLFARTFYGIEKDIAKLADILGHTSINTTRIYIVSTGEEHRKKLENMRLIL